MKFQELPVHPSLLKDLDDHGYEEATAVQAEVLAPEIADDDLLVSSRTGSGKTVAFGLAMAPLLLGEEQRAGPARKPEVLVVAPTRELALQVARELTWLYKTAGARVATCVGGMDIRREQRTLDQGAHIVVGTPGRVCDHLDRKSLTLENLKVAVLDEADEMLDMGFFDELERILKAAPTERRTLLFSATLPAGIAALAKRYTKDAKRVTATSAQEPHGDIEYVAHLVSPREREHAVVNVLRAFAPPSALVFCATRDAVSHLQASLGERGFAAAALSGELSQAERNRAMHAMREGRARILVATDVAARGLDLPAVALVVHADLPHDADVLQHRSGRTGRAGKKGTAVVLAPFARKGFAERMLRNARVKFKWTPVPSADDVRALDRRRLLDDVGALAAEVEPDDLEIARELLEQHPPEALAAALVRRERAALPAAEELPLTSGAGARTRERPASRERAEPRDRAAPRERAGPRDGGDEQGVWFRVNVGREKNADPKWLLPMLCRRGKVKKGDIGRIEIRARESRFQISPVAAERFEEAAARPDKKDPAIRIEPVKPPAPRKKK